MSSVPARMRAAVYQGKRSLGYGALECFSHGRSRIRTGD